MCGFSQHGRGRHHCHGGVFAVFHGYAHGTELAEGQSGLFYSIGFIVSPGLLHASGIGFGLIHKWDWGKTALRMTGGTIALAGIWFTWGALSG